MDEVITAKVRKAAAKVYGSACISRAGESVCYHLRALWRGGRVVEGSCLENSRTMSSVGSNPTLSAEEIPGIAPYEVGSASQLSLRDSGIASTTAKQSLLIVNIAELMATYSRAHRGHDGTC